MAEGFIQIFEFSTNPSVPNPGQNVRVDVSLFNTGYHDSALCIIDVNGTHILNLCYPTNACDTELQPNVQWNVSGTFTMPNGDANINVYSFHWENNVWKRDQTQNKVLRPGVAPCSGASISRNKTSVGVGEPVTFTLTRSPATITSKKK